MEESLHILITKSFRNSFLINFRHARKNRRKSFSWSFFHNFTSGSLWPVVFWQQNRQILNFVDVFQSTELRSSPRLYVFSYLPASSICPGALMYNFRPYLKYGREIIHSKDAFFNTMFANCVHVFERCGVHVWKIFLKTPKCSFEHVECSFENTAEKCSPKVRKQL